MNNKALVLYRIIQENMDTRISWEDKDFTQVWADLITFGCFILPQLAQESGMDVSSDLRLARKFEANDQLVT